MLSKVSPALTRQAEEVEVWTTPGRGSQTSFTRSLWTTLAARDWIISNFEFSLEWMPAFTERLKRSTLLHHTDVLRVAGRCGRMWNGVGVCGGVCMHISVCLNMIKYHIRNSKRKPSLSRRQQTRARCSLSSSHTVCTDDVFSLILPSFVSFLSHRDTVWAKSSSSWKPQNHTLPYTHTKIYIHNK